MNTSAQFDWTLMRSFLAVLEAGSLLGAARKLASSQPTLGRHVTELEAQLNCTLFERTGRGLTPTRLALQLAEHARTMESGANALLRTLQSGSRQTSGTVRITTSEVAAAYLLPPIIAALRVEEPAIQIELVASNQLTNLLRREADIAVRMVRPDQSSLIARRIGQAGIGAYAHDRYLARAGMPRTPQDLMRHSLVGYDTDTLILRGFAAMGVPLTRESFGFRTDNQIVYCKAVLAGVGIGFVTHYVGQQMPQTRRVLPELKVPALPIWLAVHREIRGNPLIRRVYDFLAERIPPAIG